MEFDMNVTSAVDFLSNYLLLFTNEEVRSWVWESEDGDFGKCASWPVVADSGMECVATVDLGLTQLQLSISERDTSRESEDPSVDSAVVFDALISFEDRTVTLNGESLGYTEDAIREVINQFNQRV
jgi:hypothetical protein